MLERFFQKAKEPLVGVDISSTSVKVMQVDWLEGRYQLVGYGIALLPPNAVVEKSIKDVDLVGQIIQKALNSAKIQAKNAAVAVAGTSVITQIIQVDGGLSPSEMEDQIFVEADRYIPYSLEEINLDFEILGPSRSKNPDLVDVMLAASKTELVDLRVAALNAAGLKAKVVDIESLAVERAFNLLSGQLPKEQLKENIALIDIGATTTTLQVIQNERTIYLREQAFGGKQLLEEIQRRYGLSLEESSKLNLYESLPDDFAPEVLQPFKESVVQQVNRALQFFYSTGDNQEIQYIVLSGGVATLVGLDETIQRKLGKKTFVANPFASMRIKEGVSQVSLLRDAPALMVACGLALRNISP